MTEGHNVVAGWAFAPGLNSETRVMLVNLLQGVDRFCLPSVLTIKAASFCPQQIP
jgi:hypothetical protein